MLIFSHLRTSPSRGFTLIELLVVFAIVTVILAVILFDTEGFNNSVLLGDLVYQIALSTRTAQTYGVSTKSTTVGVLSQFSIGYGVSFNKVDVGLTSYILFADRDGDGVYSSSGDGDPVQTFTIESGYKISSVCAQNPGGVYSPGPPCTTTKASVVFKRPDPHAYITAQEGNAPQRTGLGGVLITVQSPKGTTRSLEILQSGQISVNPS